jgi:hypothetical protein
MEKKNMANKEKRNEKVQGTAHEKVLARREMLKSRLGTVDRVLKNIAEIKFQNVRWTDYAGLQHSSTRLSDVQNRMDVLNGSKFHPRHEYRGTFGIYVGGNEDLTNAFYDRSLTKTQFESYLHEAIQEARQELIEHPEKTPKGMDSIANKIVREAALEKFNLARSLLEEHLARPYGSIDSQTKIDVKGGNEKNDK